jgi:hypothetical protein
MKTLIEKAMERFHRANLRERLALTFCPIQAQGERSLGG